MIELRVLELALIDCCVNSETLEYFEKEILNRLYHRLKDNEELYFKGGKDN